MNGGHLLDEHRMATLGREGRLHEELAMLPRREWASSRCADTSSTLLHVACLGHNEAALEALLAHGVDPHVPNDAGWRPIHEAINSEQTRCVALLLAAGASVLSPMGGASLLEWTMDCPRCRTEEVAVLLCNGARLSTVRDSTSWAISPWMVALERGVLRCRAAVVVLLGLKRRRGDVMWALDRWVVRELCFALWSTRTDRTWQGEL